MSIRQRMWRGESLHFIGSWREGEAVRGNKKGCASVREALSSLPDVFKDNEPHPLHSVDINTQHTHTH